MPEETRIFDVSRPGHGSPQATSKPVIVGHHPVMTDPMVRKNSEPESQPAPTHINVQDQLPEEMPPHGGTPGLFAEGPDSLMTHEPFGGSDSHPAYEAPIEPAQPPFLELPGAPADETAPAEVQTGYQNIPDEPAGHVEALHVAPPKRRRGRPASVILGLLVLLAAAYLAIDSGVIKSGINLPFHIFKQKTSAPAVSTPAPSSSQNQTAAALPAGFTEYKLAGTTVTFAAPSSWGQPTSTSDPGYSIRGGANKTDSTYAYLVDFAANKDVEIAVTSSKYLPAAPRALYYDLLQWCTGTSDGKIYLATLHFSTTNKVDTPTTTTCDQGPLADATKLDSSTIIQLKTKTADGKVLGDLYTKNLSNTDLPVFRIKDAASASGADIKNLLSTIKAPQAAASSSGSSSSTSTP